MKPRTSASTQQLLSRLLPRHPLHWVILSLLLAVSPHLLRFPAWASALILALCGWRLLSLSYPRLALRQWMLIIIMLPTAAVIFLTYGTLFGKTAGSLLLSVLLAIKLHECHKRRDYILLIGLSFFIIVTNFLFSQSLLTVAFMLLLVQVLIMSLISINDEGAQIDLKQRTTLASRLLLQSLPLMLLLFVLFPRISGPLWKLPEEQQTAVTGLSDSMTPGNISSLIQSNAVAFRVEFESETPPQKQLYWRALVLWYFDGRTWEQGKTNLTPWPQIEAIDDYVTYTITLEPHNEKWLYGLDMPVEVPSDLRYTNEFLLRTRKPVSHLYQYTLTSALSYQIQPTLSPWEKSAGLNIPTVNNPETFALGQQLAKTYQQPRKIVQQVLNMFNQQNFHYTLNPPPTPGFDSVDQFLFETRKGFCEHYAGSFALLMRAAGIPARVVLGYQGGTLNPLNRVMTVRQKDAHAWTEVWLNGEGWVRIDPTASIAPQRIETSLDAALSPEEDRPLHMQMNSGLMRELMFYWDAIDNRWNQWVVGYDHQLQQDFLKAMFNQDVSFSDLVILMVSGFLITLLIIVLLIVRPWRSTTDVDPVVRLYQRFCQKLARHGLIREQHEGPIDFCQRAVRTLPEQKDSITLITRLYTRLRYAPDPQERQLQQLRQLVSGFRVSKGNS